MEEEKKVAVEEKKKSNLILKNPQGKNVKEAEYFYKGEGPDYFNRVCGEPVTREDLLKVFNKVFKEEHDTLFYKAPTTELYIVIPKLKYSKSVGEEQSSQPGAFQKHSISFISEGSVNLTTLESKLKKIYTNIGFQD